MFKARGEMSFFFGWEGMLPAELIASVSGPSGGWLGISFLSGMRFYFFSRAGTSVRLGFESFERRGAFVCPRI